MTEEKNRGKKYEKEKKISNSRTQPLKTGEKEHNILIWDCTPHTDLTKEKQEEKTKNQEKQNTATQNSVLHFSFWQKQVRRNTNVGRHRFDRRNNRQNKNKIVRPIQ